ncbi:MAG: ImmA/IrrE family metallo-endopeptidase [Candidatus Aegiribacteria sp.]|nr:ImmA/IrrE family metallo-endopeptidase [Candidatus Aegiribacteria sp.]
MKIELGKRIQEFRKKFGKTQDDVAKWLGVSRATVAQIELGNRDVNSVELERIADYFGCDPLVFFEEGPVIADALGILFRANAGLRDSDELRECVSDCLKLGREVANLRRILDIDSGFDSAVQYELKVLSNKWEAVEQGNAIAAQERRRLELGNLPITDLVKLLENQGICTGQHVMPKDVSGFTILDNSSGAFIYVNKENIGVRKRFSYAHEYGHVIMDNDRTVLVSRFSERNDLIEVRANAFAASFLVPEDGCHEMIRKFGKGAAAREEVTVYDEEDSVTINKRNIKSDQAIQLYDAARLAFYFGVSLRSMIYRLKNLKYISRNELDILLMEESGFAGFHFKELMKENDKGNRLDEPDLFGFTVNSLALEAYRRNEISKGKCLELNRLVGIKHDDVAPILLLLDSEEEEPESKES